jgi:hypothetical protein
MVQTLLSEKLGGILIIRGQLFQLAPDDVVASSKHLFNIISLQQLVLN